MPLYVFQDLESGETIELPFAMKTAPRIGEDYLHNGRMYRRIVAPSQVSAGVARATHGYPYASRSLPPGTPGAKHDAKGRPIITSRRHEREFAARHGLVKDGAAVEE